MSIRYKIRGRFISWCLNAHNGWIRLGDRLIIRWENPNQTGPFLHSGKPNPLHKKGGAA